MKAQRIDDIIGAFCAAVVALLLCGWFSWTLVLKRPPSSVLNPPVYPGAELVKVEDRGNGSKHLVYTTSASWEEVMAFYQAALSREDGWVHPPSYDFVRMDVFDWYQDWQIGVAPATYRLTVGYDETNIVEIDFVKLDGIQRGHFTQ